MNRRAFAAPAVADHFEAFGIRLGHAVHDACHNALPGRHAAGKTSLSAAALALTPAAALLAKASARGAMPPDQTALRAYLIETPGQRAALSGFVRHLREHHGADVALPPLNPGLGRKAPRERLDREITRLIERNASGEDVGRRWIALALQRFHDLDRRRASEVARTAETRRIADGYDLVVGDTVYYLPTEPPRFSRRPRAVSQAATADSIRF